MRGYYSKTINKGAITCYFMALAAVSLLFMRYAMPWYTMLMGVISLLAFWHYGWRLPIKYARFSEKRFEKRLFWLVVGVYCAWAVFYYGFTMLMWDTPWEQPPWCNIDSGGYFSTAKWLSDGIRDGDITPWLDWATKDADTVVKRVLQKCPDGSIILLHDASESSVCAAFTIIDTLQKQGYEFVTVDQLILN
mgnify:CR=1 FL=1